MMAHAGLGFALVDMQRKPAPKEIQLAREWRDNRKGLATSSWGCSGRATR